MFILVPLFEKLRRSGLSLSCHAPECDSCLRRQIRAAAVWVRFANPMGALILIGNGGGIDRFEIADRGNPTTRRTAIGEAM
jgi:hypothetical protein